MLTQDEILEFKKIYEEEFGETLNQQEAHDRAIEVATYFELIADEPNLVSAATDGEIRAECEPDRQ